jgi:hypothetical protein
MPGGAEGQQEEELEMKATDTCAICMSLCLSFLNCKTGW